MDYNNLYSFKNPIRHYIKVDDLAYPTNIETMDITKFSWTKPVNFRVKKQGDKYRTLRLPNVLNFKRAYEYYKNLPDFNNINNMDPLHKRLSENLDTGEFSAGEYDRQLEEDFEKL